MGIPFSLAQFSAVLAACNASRETTTRLYVEHLVSSGKAQVHAYGACVELALRQLHWLRHGTRAPAWTEAASRMTSVANTPPQQRSETDGEAPLPVVDTLPSRGKVIAFPGQTLRDG
jgi:hypothetical protein